MKVPLLVSDFVARGEQNYPDRVAIIDEPDQPAQSWGEITFADFAHRVKAFGAGLDRLGLGVGERVAIVSQNSARLLNVIFGAAGTGRICVPINFRLKQDEVRYIVEHSEASVLLVDPELEESLKSIQCQHRFVLGEPSDSELLVFNQEPKPWEPDEDATATLNYTSGTTGRPKGVQLTHRNIWLNAVTFGWASGVTDDDVFLHTVPMFHCNGWGMPFTVLGAGGRQIVIRKVDGPEILRRIEKHGITYLCGAPAVANAILDAAAEWDGPIPGAGRVRMTIAGAPPPTKLVERLETELDWEFIQIYGLTETTPVLTMSRRRQEWDRLTPPERAHKLSRQGAPLIGIQVKVDATGEVLARGNHVMHGYWKQPDETAKAIQDGWFYTGDVGGLEADNYLMLRDRRKDVVISGGENVSSIEVEDCLFSHPQVAEVAVIGVPDEKWGETIKAIVVLKPADSEAAQDFAAEAEEADLAAMEAELIAYSRSKMAHFKCPTSVDFTDELPRTATGKVQKFRLRQPYWEGQDKFIS